MSYKNCWVIDVFPEPFAPRTMIRCLGVGEVFVEKLLLELVVRHAELSSILEDSLLTVEDESLDLMPKLLVETDRFLDFRNLVLENRDDA